MDEGTVEFSEEKQSSESQAELLQRHAQERNDLAKDFERKKSNIPRKDRTARARLAEEHSVQGRALQTRHEAELKAMSANTNGVESLTDKVVSLSVEAPLDSDSRPGESKGARRRRNRAEKKKTSNVVHQTESETVYELGDQNVDNGDSGHAPVEKKLSRAARRRLKRAQEDAASELRVAEERAAMGPGEKQAEMDVLKKQLAEHQLRVHQVAADGNCMYHAVLHQLEVIGSDLDFEASVRGIRSATADFMLSRESEFMPFLDEVEGDSEKYVDYCEQLRTEPVWGGQVELKALVGLLDVTIDVFLAGEPVMRIGESGPVLKVSYHRKYFGLGEHYNSLVSTE